MADSNPKPLVTSDAYSRFRSEDERGEEQLKSQTIGLVQLSDFRKRRAEALDSGDSGISRSPTPQAAGDAAVKFKKRKAARKGGLSFGQDGDLDDEAPTPGTATPKSRQSGDDEDDSSIIRKRLAANAGVAAPPKSQTKAALLKDAQLKDQLRKEFLARQERVRATEFIVPFVFYDGADSLGGECRMKKGDQIWRFLERARKVGAEQSHKGLKQWARISVDDLMLVRNDLIIPHHYEFYHFMINKTKGYTGFIFKHSAEPTEATPTADVLEAAATVTGGLSMPGQRPVKETPLNTTPNDQLEGFRDDPSLVKVVDRRWFERNKHIFPQSIWQVFNAEKDYSTSVRKDAEGNAYFSRPE